jgi:hypothetical protein
MGHAMAKLESTLVTILMLGSTLAGCGNSQVPAKAKAEQLPAQYDAEAFFTTISYELAPPARSRPEAQGERS